MQAFDTSAFPGPFPPIPDQYCNDNMLRYSPVSFPDPDLIYPFARTGPSADQQAYDLSVPTQTATAAFSHPTSFGYQFSAEDLPGAAADVARASDTWLVHTDEANTLASTYLASPSPTFVHPAPIPVPVYAPVPMHYNYSLLSAVALAPAADFAEAARPALQHEPAVDEKQFLQRREELAPPPVMDSSLMTCKPLVPRSPAPAAASTVRPSRRRRPTHRAPPPYVASSSATQADTAPAQYDILEYYANIPQKTFPTPSELLADFGEQQARQQVQGETESQSSSSGASAIEPDKKTERQRKALHRSVAETVGFPCTDPDNVSTHEKKRHFLECLEQYVVYLHEQIRLVNSEPIPIERVSSYRGLGSRSMRTLLVYMEDTLQKRHEKTLEEEQTFLDLRTRVLAENAETLLGQFPGIDIADEAATANDHDVATATAESQSPESYEPAPPASA